MNKKLFLTQAALALLIAVTPLIAYAQDSELDAWRQGNLFLDQSGNLSCATPGPDGQLASGSNNKEYVYNQLQLFGLDAWESAGVVGNLIAESNVDPARKQGAGYQTISSPDEIVPEKGFGLAQWTSGGRQQNWLSFAESRNEDPLSLELQTAFLWEELSNIAPAEYGFDELSTIPENALRQPDANSPRADVRQAAWIFVSFFERPATVVNAGLTKSVIQPSSGAALRTLNERAAAAQQVMDEFGIGDIETSPATCGSFTEGRADFSANPNVKVDGSPSGAHRDSNCSGGFTVGAQALTRYVKERWSPPVRSVGGYSCRPILHKPGNKTSIHGLGRALDIMIDGNSAEGKRIGDEIRDFMINNAEQLGVQRVIWYRKQWSANRDGWRDYGATGNDTVEHVDHLHVEINIEASLNADLI